MYTHWAAGFLFRRNGAQVLLVKKNRPAWQAGKLNAIGGHIEDGETPAQAMRREFLEEAGVDVPEWREFLLLKVQDGQVHFFVAHGDFEARSMTDEPVEWYDVAALSQLTVIRNLHWQIPMALDVGTKRAIVEYFQDQQ